MRRVFDSMDDWVACMKREYPGVQFENSDSHPPGTNAITAGVLVGRFYSQRSPAYGVLFDQPRSCGGRN